MTQPASTASGRALGLLVLFGIALYLCWLMLRPFIGVLMWAMVLVVIFYPAHRRILARTGSPAAAAALSTLLVIVTIFLPVVLITLAVANELRHGVEQMRGGIERLLAMPLVAPALEWLGGYVDLERWRSTEYLVEHLQSWSAAIAGPTLVFVGGVLQTIVQGLLVVFAMFYLFRDGDQLRAAVYEVVPLERAQSRVIIARTQEVIGATIYGVLAIAAIQGTLGAFIFAVLGLPSPLIWGVLMFILCLIPMAGAFLVWVPAALVLLFSGAWIKAIALAVWGVLVIGAIDNVLAPRLVGRRARLHELLIFFSVLGGLQVFGVLGLVLGPVLTAVALALLEVVRQANRSWDETAAEPVIVEPRDVRG